MPQNIIPPEENPLIACRSYLIKVMTDSNESRAEKDAAQFYLTILKGKTDRDLVRQQAFGRGVGGYGDNQVVMPLVERDEKGPILDDTQHLTTTFCIFDDLQSYLSYIERRQPVRHDMQNMMSIPVHVDGIPVEDYKAMWFRRMRLLNTTRYTY